MKQPAQVLRPIHVEHQLDIRPVKLRPLLGPGELAPQEALLLGDGPVELRVLSNQSPQVGQDQATLVRLF